MFTVRFVGGAKKSFPIEYLKIDESDISVQRLITLLLELKSKDTPKLDTDNVLIAINGADSSAINGRSTIIQKNDVVSIIPIIHGGSPKKLTFKFSNKIVQAVEIKGQKFLDVRFIDDLREKYPKLLLQAVSSNYILNSYHLKKIVSLSIESKKNNVLLSNKLETDILMRFALTMQISDAIKNVGIKPNTNFIVIAMGNKNTLNSLYHELMSDSVVLFSKNNEVYIKKYFKITKIHINSINSKNPLADILIEKAAVLL